jgi:hypothetical protein
MQLLLLVTLAAMLLEAAPASNPSGSSSTSSMSSGYVSFQRFRLTEGVWAHIEDCARLTIDDTLVTQPQALSHPPSTLTLIEKRILAAINSQERLNALSKRIETRLNR